MIPLVEFICKYDRKQKMNGNFEISEEIQMYTYMNFIAAFNVLTSEHGTMWCLIAINPVYDGVRKQ